MFIDLKYNLMESWNHIFAWEISVHFNLFFDVSMYNKSAIANLINVDMI